MRGFLRCSDGPDVRGLRALLALTEVVLDLLGFIQVAVPITGDRAEVYEHICAAIVRSDEAEALLRAEPLHGSSCHCDPSFLPAVRATFVLGGGRRDLPVVRELLVANRDRYPR